MIFSRNFIMRERMKTFLDKLLLLSKYPPLALIILTQNFVIRCKCFLTYKFANQPHFFFNVSKNSF